MNTHLILEIAGYTGSFIVLVSFLMASVVKLRVINSIGSVVSAVYSLLVHSYPMAFLNSCLVCINIYYLIRLSRNENHYDVINTSLDDSYLKYVLNYYADDIRSCFPSWNLAAANCDVACLVCCDSAPAGVLLGSAQNDGSLRISLDYSTPAYRDCSVGKFLYSKLSAGGVRRLIYAGDTDRHESYLKKMGFDKETGEWSLKL